MAGKTIDKGDRQFGQCAHVEIDHLKLLAAVARRRQADQSKTCIVDDELWLRPIRRQRVTDLPHGVGRRQVARNYDRPPCAGCRDLVGKFLQPVFAPGHQRQLMAVPGKYASERYADPGRRSSDQGNGARVCHIVIVPARALIASRQVPPVRRAITAISANAQCAKRSGPWLPLLDGLALAVAFFQEADVVLNVLVVWILAQGGGKRCVCALVVAAQHV
jgi:hypothetical protein